MATERADQTSKETMVGSLVLVFVLLLLVKLLLKPKTGKPRLPPSPTKLPIIGNLHQLGSLPHRSLAALSRKHGPLMLIYFGTVPNLVVSSEEMAREIMKTHDLIFSDRPTSIVTDQLLYHGKDISFAPYGEYWRQVRRISVLHVLSPKRVESFQSVREEEVRLTINNIAKSSGLINIGEIMISTTNNIISRVAFGRKYYEEKGRVAGFPKMLAEFLALLGTVHIGDMFPSLAWVGELTGLNARLKKNFQEWDEFLGKVIEEHLDPCRTVGDGYKQDFVDILLDIEKNGEIGFPIGKDGLKAIILDNFAAGTDTIYTALVWIMTELIRDPRVLNKVQAEIREATHGRDQVLEDDIEHMLYMKSVVKEAMRLHPPLPLLVPRQLTQDIELNGYHIPARTRVMINAWAIGMDPKSWEAPDQFWPERFMDSTSKSIGIDLRGHDFQLIPFGAGRRGCPAVSYAIVEIEYVLASLLQRFDWELPEGSTIEDVDMTETFGMTAHKKSPLLLIAKDHFQH